jgi:hypothetical protein
LFRRRLPALIAAAILLLVLLARAAEPPARQKGVARAEVKHPERFPHRIWAACDFEGRTPDYAWFGEAETAEIPRYPGNATALRAPAGPYEKVSALMTGVNPVPGPRMGKQNHLYCRYFLEGADEAVFQHFSLTREDNQHIRVGGLARGQWSEVTLDWTRDAARNDGSPEPFADGERMDDFKLFVGKPGDGKKYRALIDDLIFFAEDPTLPPESERFPNRVIFLAAFDTGPKDRYWPGDFEIVEERAAPPDSYWRVARAILRKDGKGKLISLAIDPPRPVGEETKLRFRYFARGVKAMVVQIFDLTAEDNRHLRLEGLEQDRWTTTYVNFTRDSRRNDGSQAPFSAGHKVDDLFFFVDPGAGEAGDLFVDEVVLFDAGQPASETGKR